MSSGTVTDTSNVQLLPAGTDPAVKLKLEVPLISEPVPQILLCGNPLANMPEIAASRSSVNASPAVVKALPALLMVNRTAVVLLLLRVLGTNVLLKVGGVATTVSCALAAATGRKPVPVNVLVVFVYVPGAVVGGTVTGTSNVQLPPAGTEPAVKLKLELPVICEPVPQILFAGKPVASMPDNAASRSSVNANPAVVKALPELSMINRIDEVLELLNVLGVNALLNVGAVATTLSCALAAATGLKPVPVRVLVVLV